MSLSLEPWAAIVTYFVLCTGGIVYTLSDSLLQGKQWIALESSSMVQEFVHRAAQDLIKSELGVFLLLNFLLSFYALTALLTTVIFLGNLSPRESTRLTERLFKYIIFKVVFVGAVVTPHYREVLAWITWFAIIGYMKMFMGAAKDRLETLMTSPYCVSRAHMRAVGLLLTILVNDVLTTGIWWHYAMYTSGSRALLFVFDSAVIAVDGLKTLLRYGIHLADQGPLSDFTWAKSLPPPVMRLLGLTICKFWGTSLWEAFGGKGSLLYHLELVSDLMVQIMTLLHYLHVWMLHGLSLHFIDALLFMDVRSVALSLVRRVKSHLHYQAATHNLNHTFPTEVTDQEVECAICRDGLQVAKRLSCGHLFHLGCLRAWLQQSGSDNFTCPICRASLFIVTNNDNQAGTHRLPPQRGASFRRRQFHDYVFQSAVRTGTSAALTIVGVISQGPGSFARMNILGGRPAFVLGEDDQGVSLDPLSDLDTSIMTEELDSSWLMGPSSEEGGPDGESYHQEAEENDGELQRHLVAEGTSGSASSHGGGRRSQGVAQTPEAVTQGRSLSWLPASEEVGPWSAEVVPQALSSLSRTVSRAVSVSRASSPSMEAESPVRELGEIGTSRGRCTRGSVLESEREGGISDSEAVSVLRPDSCNGAQPSRRRSVRSRLGAGS